MESSLSGLSSLKEDDAPLYVQPHYKESYRLAIYALLCGGKEAYEEFLRAEQISHFLSDEEILFILENGELPDVDEEDALDEKRTTEENAARTSTYFPTESDDEVPDLELGWPEVSLEGADTSISLLFHPPRDETPSIKEVVRKQIQEARQIIAIAMDVFTDVDIFKEIITATLKGVVVYILLDESNFKSFLAMSHRVGVNVQDFKNIRVRTVQGQQYQCQSGAKFHGGLEQKFMLVDCRTVMYGTFSYTWTFEKINLSMVMVITGQLVCSYDEEFRRLYARSTVPAVQSKTKIPIHYLRDTMNLKSPNSSQLSLNQINMRSRAMHGMRGAQDDRFNNPAILSRGLSMQERLHQSHCVDMGNLVRGHSYGEELQRLNSMTRLRMGTKDFGTPLPPERAGSNLRMGGDLLLSNRLSQQHHRHRNRYGADQNLIPFNSETSLHRWKMDTYLNNEDMPLDAFCDAISPMTSPYSSHTGLNEYQSQQIQSRSRDIKSRMEEMRQKRLSLQEYNNFRQSQESLRSMYPALDRPKLMTSLRGLDMRQSMADLEPNTQNGWCFDQADHKDNEPKNEGNKREQPLTDGHRSASHNDVKMVPDQRTMQTYDWREPLSRTTSAAEIDLKLNDPSLKFAHLQASGLSLQHPRAMESLTQIPEEKEGSNSHVNSSDSAFKEGNEEDHKEEKASPEEIPVKPSSPAETQTQDQARGSHSSLGKASKSSGSLTPKARKKSLSNEVQTLRKNSSTSSGSQLTLDSKSSRSEKGQPLQEESSLQRKNSMKIKSMLTPDDKKTSKREENPLQRKGSMRSHASSGSSQPVRAEHPHKTASEKSSRKGHSPSTSRPPSALSGAAEAEKPKSPFPRLSTQRSSKKKASQAAEQDRGSKATPGKEGATVYQREKVYSRFEYLLSTESIPRDKSSKGVGAHPSDKERGASLNRHESRYQGYQTQTGSENKLGRFMQRVGNLISKNK